MALLWPVTLQNYFWCENEPTDFKVDSKSYTIQVLIR